MEKIEDVEILPLTESKYVQPYRMNYKQDGEAKTWEALKEHESVCILIYNKTKDCFVFVSQFRPAVYCSAVRHLGGDTEKTIDTDKYPGSMGITYELCAGLVDKDKGSAMIAKEEVLEECGYDVPVESLELVTSYRSSVGTSGSHMCMYYVTVTDQQKRTAGGGIDTEMIRVVYVDRQTAIRDYADGTQTDVQLNILLKYGLLWFQLRKQPNLGL